VYLADISQKISVSRDERVLIGAVSVNSSCPRSSMEGQEIIRAYYQDCLEWLGVSALGWKREALNLTVQAGQYFVPSITLGYKRTLGTTLK
jgi:hypothetical protein